MALQVEIPQKHFFKIGEVSRIIGVPEHTIRYWEDEFAQIRPQKTRSGQRLYQRKDVELLLEIKQLLWEKKYKIAGARRQLRSRADEQARTLDRVQRDAVQRRAIANEVKQTRDNVAKIRAEVASLLDLVRNEESRGVAQSG